MPERSFFQNALTNFTNEAANGGAIRHLTDMGYSTKQIMERLDFPASFERVQKEMWNRLIETGILLLEEPDGTTGKKVSYVREYNEYGRASFRRVSEPQRSGGPIRWKEITVRRDPEALWDMLREKLAVNGEDASYVSCDFGLLEHREPGRFEELLQKLDEAQREYLRDLPWVDRRVYHRLDERMRSVLMRLAGSESCGGEYFFLKTGEKVCFCGEEKML